MVEDDTGLTLDRRSVLKTVPATGAYLSLGELSTGQVTAAANGSDVRLGEFSDGFDGWTTTGGNELTRVSEDEMPVAVQVGTHALAVEIDGDLHPMIENTRRVREADFVEHPYLQAHVAGFAEETNSEMVFKFRLHHTAAPTDDQENGNGGSGGDGGKDVLVEESDEQTAAQLHPHLLRWNLTDFDEEILATANRLEIVWYLEDHPPERGHRGRARGDFDYQGFVVIDDVRLTDDVTSGEAEASRDKKLALHRKHGMIVERTYEERTDAVERGTLLFGDGTEIPFTFEILDDGRFRYTIDGESFLLGGMSDE